MLKILSTSSQQTIQLGQSVGRLCRAGDVICLRGDLGSGKTTFVKGLAKGLRIKSDDVISPTFVLMNIYEGKLPVYHFDLYRLEEMNEISLIGFEEFIEGDGVAVIEWAERLESLTPKEYLSIDLTHKNDDQRSIKIQGYGKRYKEMLQKLDGK